MTNLEIIRTIILFTTFLVSYNTYKNYIRVSKHQDLIENHKDVIEQQQKTLENHKKAIEQNQKDLRNHKDVIENYYFKIKELELEIEKLKEKKE